MKLLRTLIIGLLSACLCGLAGCSFNHLSASQHGTNNEMKKYISMDYVSCRRNITFSHNCYLIGKSNTYHVTLNPIDRNALRKQLYAHTQSYSNQVKVVTTISDLVVLQSQLKKASVTHHDKNLKLVVNGIPNKSFIKALNHNYQSTQHIPSVSQMEQDISNHDNNSTKNFLNFRNYKKLINVVNK